MAGYLVRRVLWAAVLFLVMTAFTFLIYLVLVSASVTACVVVGGILLALLIAVPVGILSALRPRSKLDRGGMTLVLLGISMHPLIIALTLSYVFGARLRVLPSSGYCDVFRPTGTCGGPRNWASHLILPWIAF